MDGILLADKPEGRTSFWTVARIKRISRAAKAGHAGTLDPFATGVLVIGLGRTTRILKYVETFDKVYEGVIRLGITTETDDVEGAVLRTGDARGISASEVGRALSAFRGVILQRPPRYSAIKIRGERAYKRARRGERFEPVPRRTRIDEITLTGYSAETQEAAVRVRCAKGTYIRSLARDLGEALGCGAHLKRLCRRAVGPLDLSRAVRLTDETDAAAVRAALIPVREVLAHLDDVAVGQGDALALKSGRRVAFNGPLPGSGEVLVYNGDRAPFCIGRIQEKDGRNMLIPVRML
jgi:tRNA pseudouridine55 synthase